MCQSIRHYEGNGTIIHEMGGGIDSGVHLTLSVCRGQHTATLYAIEIGTNIHISSFYPPSQKATGLLVDECASNCSASARCRPKAEADNRVAAKGEDGYFGTTTGLPVGLREVIGSQQKPGRLGKVLKKQQSAFDSMSSA
jgi:hypothetical protein